MVLSMPFSTSTTPLILPIASATFGAQSASKAWSCAKSLIWTGCGALVRSPIRSDAVQYIYNALDLADRIRDFRSPVGKQSLVLRKELDLDRLRRARKISDHILQNLNKLHVQRRFFRLYFAANLFNHFVDTPAAIILQLHRYVSGIRLRYRGQAELHSGAPGGTLDFRNFAQYCFDMSNDTIRLRERTAGRHDVVHDKTALIHFGEQVRAQEVVTDVRDRDQCEAQHGQPFRMLQRAAQPLLMEVHDLEKEAADGGIFSRQQTFNVLFVFSACFDHRLARFAMLDKKLAESGSPRQGQSE